MPIANIQQLQAKFSQHGVKTLYLKQLSPKQDNEKNQIYLGGRLDGVMNLFASEIRPRSASQSGMKRKSQQGKPKLEAKLDLAWIDDNGVAWPAPSTTIIEYFQYPEVRLSGFLKGCKNPPDALRRRNQAQYGQRILAFGPSPGGTVYACVLTQSHDPLVSAFPDLPVLAAAPVLRVLVTDKEPGRSPLELIRAELRAIFDQGWHRSVVLKDARIGPVPFHGNQGGGYTLEALLGVEANSRKGPDKYGFEVKAYGGQKLTLTTPVPDGGFQGQNAFRRFMEVYAHDGKSNDGSRRFTGVHRCGEVNASTGMTLVLEGYDPASGEFVGNTDEIGVAMIVPGQEIAVARWSLSCLASSWTEKHASAIYVSVKKRGVSGAEKTEREYSFGPTALVGQGTDVWKLLKAIQAGIVYYDPADAIYADGKPKNRPQWRMRTSGLEGSMRSLYNHVEVMRP
jgi:hypothetical protein